MIYLLRQLFIVSLHLLTLGCTSRTFKAQRPITSLCINFQECILGLLMFTLLICYCTDNKQVRVNFASLSNIIYIVLFCFFIVSDLLFDSCLLFIILFLFSFNMHLLHFPLLFLNFIAIFPDFIFLLFFGSCQLF